MSDVKLNISATAKTGSKWKSATASNGVEYWYMFTGGNGGNDNGNQDFETGTQQQFDIVFKGSDGDCYQFQSFDNKDSAADLSGVVNANNIITVTDKCTVVGDFNYGVTVELKNSNPTVTINCDPVISNKLKAELS